MKCNETAEAGSERGSVEMIQDRIREASQQSSNARIARLTGFNCETVRRYLGSGTPSLAFVLKVCEVWNLRADWLLFGTTPRARAEQFLESDGSHDPESAVALVRQLLEHASSVEDRSRNSGRALPSVRRAVPHRLSVTTGS